MQDATRDDYTRGTRPPPMTFQIGGATTLDTYPEISN